MVRLNDLHPDEHAHMLARLDGISPIESAAWVTPPALADAKVALVSTAGLHRRSDRPFNWGAVDYRLIPGDVDPADLVMSHASTNFDRSAYQEDLNVCLPIDRLNELVGSGDVGSAAAWHYSFMGAMPDPANFEATGEEVGRLLAADGVDVALLIPV
ncbi:MAG: glycine/sarcosine/betaine reductase selenoprotein B family protein [Acidimicrobiales bacterium]|jgi:D-proline reductase (dithiol) PrdB